MVAITKLAKSIVRVFDQNDNIVGAGFLATENSIITCSHIIPHLSEFEEPIPLNSNDRIVVDFPLIALSQQLQTRLIFNSLTDEMDFAELESVNISPSNTNAPSTIANIENLLGHHIRAYGFPAGYDDGIWTLGVVTGMNAKGWLQVEGFKESGYRIQPGFSGGPVWDEQLEAVIGIVIAADKQEKTKAAFVLPMSTIIKNYPDFREKLRSANSSIYTSDAMEFLDHKDYDKVLALCSENLKEDQYIPHLHLFAAIALTRGKPLERVSPATVKFIENHLLQATFNNATEGTALAILGAVKFDYYVINGLPEKEPTFRQISKRLQVLGFQSIDFPLLKHLKISEGALRNMGLKLRY